MKLERKLPLAFALALGLLFASSMFGLHQLNSSIDVYENEVARSVEAHRIASEAGTDFSAAIQEWKNVLLRGKDEKKSARIIGRHMSKRWRM